MLIRAIRRAGRETAYWSFRAACSRLPSPAFDPSRVRKILLPLYAGIGNVVLYTPALRAIRDRFAGAEIVAAVGNSRRNDEVVGAPLVDRFVEIPLDATLTRRRQDLRLLREERFDLSINAFHCSQPYHAAMTAFAGATWRCGHVTSPGWRNPYDFLFNLPAAMERDQYEVDRYLELAYALGVQRDSVDKRPSFRVTDDARTDARVALADRGIAPGALLVAVHAGTSHVMRWKQWGPERFGEVVERLAAERPELTFAFVGAPDERDEQMDVLRRLSRTLPGRFADLVGATDVRSLGAVLEQALLLVGNDSGPMQIAVALGVPTVVPWGPSDLPRNAPRGPEHTILFKGLPCSPCYRMPGDTTVHLCGDHQCLKLITVDEVARAAADRLAVALQTR